MLSIKKIKVIVINSLLIDYFYNLFSLLLIVNYLKTNSRKFEKNPLLLLGLKKLTSHIKSK